jgi:hypothetical protein
MWILRAFDFDTDELEREFTLPNGFVPPCQTGRLSCFLAHDLADRYGLPIPEDARVTFYLDFEREPGREG